MARHEWVAHLQELADELETILANRETSIPEEPSPPSAIRGTPLYCSVQVVEQHYGGKLPLDPPFEPWQAWREMLWRADEGQGEPDSFVHANKFYRYAKALQLWAMAEAAELGQPSGRDARGSEKLAAPTKYRSKSRGGRPPDPEIADPEIAKRNQKIVKAFKEGVSVDDVCQRFNVSAVLARKIKSNARISAPRASKGRES